MASAPAPALPAAVLRVDSTLSTGAIQGRRERFSAGADVLDME